MEKQKKERLVTPVGEAKWAHIQKPKKAFEEGGEPSYQLDVVFSPDDPDWKGFVDDVNKRLDAMPVQKKAGEAVHHQSPIKKEVDQEDNPTGRLFVTFKTGVQFKPRVFDKNGLIIPEETLVGNGSSVRVNYTPNEYPGFGGGINFYLNAVHVLELVEFSGGTAKSFGFETALPF